MPTSYFLESVDRVMQVLDAFSAEDEELRLTDLSVRLGMPKPQVLRIASTLQTGGYIERDPATKRYRLGLRLFQLGMLVREQMNLSRVATPVLQRLAAETDETVGVFRADPKGAVCLDVIDSSKSIRVFAQVGRTMPWHAGASGKAILALMPAANQDEILATTTFDSFSARTVTSEDELSRELAQVRTDGYAISDGDLDPDAFGVSAPVLDASHRVVGAISIGAPRSRVSPEVRTRLIELVRTGAAEVSQGLGYVEGAAVPPQRSRRVAR